MYDPPRLGIVKEQCKQAGPELCQAQHSLSQLHTRLDFATPLLGMLTQPAVDRAESFAEVQLRIYWHKGGGMMD